MLCSRLIELVHLLVAIWKSFGFRIFFSEILQIWTLLLS